MKKVFSLLLLTMILFLSLFSCSGKNNDFYEFPSSGISKITGTSYLSDSPKTVEFSGKEQRQLRKRLNALSLKATDQPNDFKGSEYWFVFTLENGETIQVFLSPKYVAVNGFLYETDAYRSDDFAAFFE